MILRLKLWWARVNRDALRRERKSLHQQRGGIDWMLARNARDAGSNDVLIMRLEDALRQRRFACRYPVRRASP